ELGREDLRGMRGTHGGQAVRVREAALDEGEHAVKLEGLGAPQRRRQSQLVEGGAGEKALVCERVDREQRARARGMARQERRRQPRVPVVAVEDLRAPVEARTT